MRVLKMLAFALGGLLLGEPAFAQRQFPCWHPAKRGPHRRESQGNDHPSDWFNIWVVNHGGISNGLQQLCMDTLWYIDPDVGIDGVWDNSPGQ